MAKYYFLASALPALASGTPPEISFADFQDLLRDNLYAHDLKKTEIIRRYYDIQNIRAIWKNESFNSHGNFDRISLEDALVAQQDLPDYIYDYLESHDSLESRLRDFPALFSTFFKVESAKATGFLKEY